MGIFAVIGVFTLSFLFTNERWIFPGLSSTTDYTGSHETEYLLHISLLELFYEFNDVTNVLWEIPAYIEHNCIMHA